METTTPKTTIPYDSMEYLLFMINLSLECLEMKAISIERVSSNLTFEIRDKAISQYCVYSLGCYIKTHFPNDRTDITNIDVLQDLLSDIEVENVCVKIVSNASKIKNIEEKIN